MVSQRRKDIRVLQSSRVWMSIFVLLDFRSPSTYPCGGLYIFPNRSGRKVSGSRRKEKSERKGAKKDDDEVNRHKFNHISSALCNLSSDIIPLLPLLKGMVIITQAQPRITITTGLPA